MAEAFTGKWIPDKSSLKGAEEYIDEVDGTEEDLENIKKVKEVEISFEDNTFKFVSRWDEKEPRTEVHTLGETRATMDGSMKLVSTTRLDGNQLITEVTYGDRPVKIVRSLEDDCMYTEISSGGKTLSLTLVRSERL